MNILLYSSLFPNREQPRLGLFVERRLAELQKDFDVSATMVAPVPWFPLSSDRFGAYGDMACSSTSGEVHHPRYPVIPKLSWRFSPYLMYRATVGRVRALHRERNFDLIDAHFYYPDGVAAVMVGRALDLPVVITARGSDLVIMPNHPLPRRFITYAARHAAGMGF